MNTLCQMRSYARFSSRNVVRGTRLTIMGVPRYIDRFLETKVTTQMLSRFCFGQTSTHYVVTFVDRTYQYGMGSALLCRNVKRFRSGLVFKVRRLCVSLNSRLQSNDEEEEGSALTCTNRGHGSEDGSYLRLIDLCITQLQAEE